ELKIRQRVRIRFSKLGDLRLIGHRDLARLLERVFRRAGLRLSMSEGFHPKPRISFPSALAVGFEGHNEVMELELAENWTPRALQQKLDEFCPPGITFGSIEVCPPGAKKAQVRSLTYAIPIDSRHGRELPDRIRRLMASESCVVLRQKDQKPIDLRPRLESLSLSGDVLSMSILAAAEATPGAREVLAALELPPAEVFTGTNGLYPRRTTVELKA
ncbi:MAG: TIGR03936 family radical SAM-associated protein, partial [Planctomycetota bacterium]|nr:TIGR03936 family radical SAM-associated protein [Planctomycetota bacterium]